MGPRTAIAIALLASGIVPAYGQESWRAAMSKAERLKAEGRLTEAVRAYRSALDEARPLEPDPVSAATAYHNLGSLYQDLYQYDRAIEAYLRSLELWRKAGPRGEGFLLRTANHLVSAYLECGAIDDAERQYRALVAPLIAARPGRDRDPDDVAQALANFGSIQHQKHRYRDARTAYEEALAIRQRIPAEPSLEIAVLVNNLAMTLMRLGETDRALAESRRSLALFESAAEPSNPLYISALVNSANLQRMARRRSEAEPLLERALALARFAFGDDHLITAAVMWNYATLLKESHRNKEAEVLEGRVREIRARFFTSAARQTIDIRELSPLSPAR